VISIFRLKLFPAPFAGTNLRLSAIFATAMRIEGRSAVRANDPQVLQAVVIGDSIDVIEDQRHRPSPPVFALAAHLAASLLQIFEIKSLLQLVPWVVRISDQHLLEWRSRFRGCPSRRCAGIEVVRRDLPPLEPFFEEAVIAARNAHA
jgi:hypothetical protein